MLKTITQLSAILILIVLFTSCSKESDPPTTIRFENVHEIPIVVDQVGLTSWIVDDVYIYPIIRDSILYLNAYDVNLKEKIWELESVLDKNKLSGANMIDDKYLISYGDQTVTIFDIDTQEWTFIHENDLITNYKSHNAGYTYSRGKIYGSLRLDEFNSIIYCFDIKTEEVSVVYHSISDRPHLLTTIVFETDKESPIEMYAVATEFGDLENEDFMARWKLLHISGTKIVEDFVIKQDTTYLPKIENLIVFQDDLLAINGSASVYIINRNNGCIVSSYNFISLFGRCSTKLIDDQLFVLGGTRLLAYSTNIKRWVFSNGYKTYDLSNIEVKDDFIFYSNTSTYQLDSIQTSELHVRDRFYGSKPIVEDIEDILFSTPRYCESIDQYIYHTLTKIKWIDVVIE